jgi:hypothetical protein
MKFWEFLNGKSIDGIWLSDQQQRTLIAVYQGVALRSQRDIEGGKVYELRSETSVTPIALKTVLGLRKKRLIETNHKFPSATYLLTTRGESIAMKLTDGQGSNPVSARDFVQPRDER